MSSVIETASGIAFNPILPDVRDIRAEDIAHALGHQCRFSGHTREHYSVAQHCVLVAELLKRWGCDRETIFRGLLHDASEAYLVDLPKPVKALPEMQPYRDAEARLQRLIFERYGLAPSEPTADAAVHRADMILLATEARDLMPFRIPHWIKLTEKPMRDEVVPWAPSSARRAWMARFVEVAT